MLYLGSFILDVLAVLQKINTGPMVKTPQECPETSSLSGIIRYFMVIWGLIFKSYIMTIDYSLNINILKNTPHKYFRHYYPGPQNANNRHFFLNNSNKFFFLIFIIFEIYKILKILKSLRFLKFLKFLKILKC